MSRAKEVKAPNIYGFDNGFTNIFLAGSIENGIAERWQQRVVKALEDYPIQFLNPRRDDWNPSWSEETNKDKLVEQINWELTALEFSDMIIMYIDPNTASPISLLELGLHARNHKMVVFCPNGFYRKTNVDVTCQFFGVDQVETFGELLEYVKNHI